MAPKRLNGYGVALLLAVLAAGTAPVAAEAGGVQEPLQPDNLAADCRAIDPTTPDPAKISGDVPIAERQAIEATARARYLRGDLGGALDALNQLAEPRVRCLNVDGLVRTDRRVIIDYLGTRSGEVFTAEALARAGRRLEDLSFVSSPSLRFDPAPDGTSTITPIARERSMLPKGLGWGDVLLRAVFQQDLRVRLVSPSGHGEVWTPSVRPSPNRPRARLRFTAPAPGRLPGLLNAEALAERQSYAYPSMGEEYRETRYRLGGGFSDWVTSWLRWEAGVAFDQIASVSRVAVEGRLNARALDDRLALIATAGYWLGAGDGSSFGTREFVATARSTAVEEEPVVTTLVGVADASDLSPLAVWPAASPTQSRGATLRAHPLRTEGIITGEAFGRRLFFSTTEYQHPLHTRWGTVALALFVDAAQAWRRVDGSTSPFHVDVGTGVRLKAFGSSAIRTDIGYGLRDGRVRVSAGYDQAWGTR
jgi:hypothetical protein